MQDRDGGRPRAPTITFRELRPGERPVGPVERVQGEVVGRRGAARTRVRQKMSRRAMLFLAGGALVVSAIGDRPGNSFKQGEVAVSPPESPQAEEPESVDPTPVVPPPAETPAPIPPPPDRGERKRNVEGDSEVPIVVGNDMLKIVRKAVKQKNQGPANYGVTHISDEDMIGLYRGLTKRQLEGKATSQNTRGEVERNLQEVPKYVASDMSSVLWDMKLKKALIPPSVEIDYESNKNLKPTKIQLTMMVPLNELAGTGLKVQSRRNEGKVMGMIDMGQVPVLLREVINMDFLKPGTRVETMETDRYIIVGKQASDNASVEIVGAADGRITIVIKQASHKLRPGERPRAQLPPIPR